MAETLLETEKTLIENEFGTVTTKRVIYYRNKGWISGGSREDIPLQHVTSVSLEINRRIVLGLFMSLVAIVGFNIGGVGIVFWFLSNALAIILVWGSPTVIVNTSGRDINAAIGWPWKRAAANAFVDTLRQQLFSK